MMLDEDLQFLLVHSRIANDLKSGKKSASLLSQFRKQQKNDKIIFKQLVRIIKLSAHQEESKAVAGKALSIIKKITKVIRNENFSNINLKDCSLRGISFVDCDFSQSILENVNIDSCWFIECCLDKVRWINIKCSEQKVVQFRNSSILRQVIPSSDGTRITFLIQKGENNIIEIHDCHSGNVLGSLQIDQSINKIIFINQEIIAFINFFNKKQTQKICFQNINSLKFIAYKLREQIFSLHSSQNGMIILEGYRKIILRETFNFKSLRKILCKEVYLKTTLSKNGKYIAFQYLDQTQMWDLVKGKYLQLEDNNFKQVQALVFSPNTQKLLAVRENLNILQWNIKELNLEKSIELINTKISVKLSNQDQVISNAESIILILNDGTLRFYNIQSNQFTTGYIYQRQIKGICFHPQKQIMLLHDDMNIYYLDYRVKQKKSIKQSYSINTEQFEQFSLSQNGDYISIINEQNQVSIFKIFDWKKQTCIKEQGITSIAFSPISNILAFGKYDSSIFFYDIQEQKLLRQLKVNGYGEIKQLQFSPNGLNLALIGYEHQDEILLLNAETGIKLHSLQDKYSYFIKMTFSSSGQMLASLSRDQIIRLWNLQQPDKFISFKTLFTDFIFSPDDKLFVYINQQIVFFEIAQNQNVKQISNSKNYRFIQYSSDGSLLFCCSNKEIDVMEVETGILLQSVRNQKLTNFFHVSKNGKFLVQGYYNNIILWDIYCQKTYQTLQKFHDQPIRYLVYSQQNQILISGEQNGQVMLYNYSKKEQLKNLKNISNQKIQLSKSGMYLIYVVEDLIINLLNLKTLVIDIQLRAQNDKILAIVISDDDYFILFCEASFIYIWNITQQQIVKTLNFNCCNVNQIFFGQNDQEILIQTSKEIIQISQIWGQSQEKVLLQSPNEITQIKIFPDRRSLVFGCQDGKISIYDLLIKQITKELYEHDDEIIDISFSFDGSIFASVSKDETICFWQTKSGILYEKTIRVKGINSITFLMKDSWAFGEKDGNVKLIKFLRNKIRPLNSYPKYFEATRQYNSSFQDAEIISTHGFNLVDVLQISE